MKTPIEVPTVFLAWLLGLLDGAALSVFITLSAIYPHAWWKAGIVGWVAVHAIAAFIAVTEWAVGSGS